MKNTTEVMNLSLYKELWEITNTLYTDNIQIKCFIKFIGYCSLII